MRSQAAVVELSREFGEPELPADLAKLLSIWPISWSALPTSPVILRT